MAKRLGYSLLLSGILLLAAGSAGAGPSSSQAGASARAYAVTVVIPGQVGAATGAVAAPPDRASFGPSFAYPADGSVVTTGALATSASSDVSATASASASSEIEALSIFGGEISATAVSGEASGSTRGRVAGGRLSTSSVAGLSVLGQPTSVTPNGRVPLADWGYLITLEQGAETNASVSHAEAYHGFVTALDVHLTAPHGGLPAGSEIQVGFAEASVQASGAPAQTPVPPGPGLHRKRKTPRAPEPTKKRTGPPAPILSVPTGLQPRLTAGGYVFPVYGPSSYTDTFGAPRADVTYHHGDDIFAPLGAPLLACADGLVFSVGWNDIGGNRLWLRDNQGNEFYYAHLSAFSPLAKNGHHVKAGEVVGFVGNTGDAAGTPTHLHFEVHPVALLFMGYDGAVDPTPYLDAWKHLQDVRFLPNVEGWVPAVAVSDPAPKPGAILLQVSDISEGSGLDPGSLQRAMVTPVSAAGNRALLRSLGFRAPRGDLGAG